MLSLRFLEVPLSIAFTESHRFGVVVFSFSFISMHIFISFLISSVIWLFRSVLFSIHMFVFLVVFFLFSSVQSLSRVRLFATHESQHARPPCPSPTPEVHSDLRPLSQ